MTASNLTTDHPGKYQSTRNWWHAQCPKSIWLAARDTAVDSSRPQVCSWLRILDSRVVIQNIFLELRDFLSRKTCDLRLVIYFMKCDRQEILNCGRKVSDILDIIYYILDKTLFHIWGNCSGSLLGYLKLYGSLLCGCPCNLCGKRSGNNTKYCLKIL